jgi:HTH-type transcriptional regulator/antitoxin HipB
MRQLVSTPDQIGQLLAAARRAAGLTQTQAAARIGVSQGRISAMELDPASISLDQLLALAAAYRLQLIIEDRTAQADPSAPPTDW